MLGSELVSIVVPVYNIDKIVLGQCIDSILCQTYKNIEILIIDDGSKEDCSADCDKYSCADVISVYHKENGGASTARNYGIEKAKGSFITFIDADDWIDFNYIQRMFEHFETDTDIVICDRTMEYPNKSEESYFFPTKQEFNDKEAKRELIMTTINIPVGGTWCKMYRKDFIEKQGLRYDINLRRTQDVIFNLYAFYHASRIVYIHEALYHYRMDNLSITKKYSDNANIVLTQAAYAFQVYGEYAYPNDEAVQKLVYYRNINIISEIMKLKYFNPDNKNSYLSYKNEFKQLIALDVYQKAINGILPLTISQKYLRNTSMENVFTYLKVWLLKKQCIYLLRVLMNLQKRLQNARNFNS